MGMPASEMSTKLEAEDNAWTAGPGPVIFQKFTVVSNQLQECLLCLIDAVRYMVITTCVYCISQYKYNLYFSSTYSILPPIVFRLKKPNNIRVVLLMEYARLYHSTL